MDVLRSANHGSHFVRTPTSCFQNFKWFLPQKCCLSLLMNTSIFSPFSFWFSFSFLWILLSLTGLSSAYIFALLFDGGLALFIGLHLSYLHTILMWFRAACIISPSQELLVEIGPEQKSPNKHHSSSEGLNLDLFLPNLVI